MAEQRVEVGQTWWPTWRAVDKNEWEVVATLPYGGWFQLQERGAPERLDTFTAEQINRSFRLITEPTGAGLGEAPDA